MAPITFPTVWVVIGLAEARIVRACALTAIVVGGVIGDDPHGIAVAGDALAEVRAELREEAVALVLVDIAKAVR